MEVLVMIGQLLLGLSILIVLHEGGHFLAARAFGIKVEKFYLFFDAYGFKLFSFTYKEVEYGIGWLPLGGYVKIAGMIDESMDTEAMALPPQPWEFRSKPAWQRLIVMLGGIAVNIIVGIFIFWMLTFKYGETYIPNDQLKFGIAPGIVGDKMGLQGGDKILAINGKKLERFDEIRSSKVFIDKANITVLRNGETKIISVPADILNTLSDASPADFISPRMKAEIDSVMVGGYAAKAGLLKGDLILSVNGESAMFFDQLKTVLASQKNQTVQVTALRNGGVFTLPVMVSGEGTIGFAVKPIEITTKTQEFGFFSALPAGISKAWGTFVDNFKGIGKIFKGEVRADKALSGPITIARKLYGGVFDWAKFWSITGLLSMGLALMNLLPIPALDGGHSVFLLVEIIKGKPLSDKFMERAQIVGFVILAALMVFALGNDIFKAVF
ncbi:MAG: RIP metalloprotease RseP [Sphingobacteriales bacterium]|nr:MAG: RIP metalloprotease RseP [Sphingobacteriales bacterium]TAF80381.1 MAG: RIP metalloprotease RseP [Sphingobacteriales bacterium]